MAAITPRATPVRFSVSVVVPCAAAHVVHLPELIRHLNQQTDRPNEIIVAVSGLSRPPTLPTNTVPVKIVHDGTKRNAAQNRNRGTAASRSHVVVYQDADDIPHTQRIEVVRHLFMNFEIEHLMHGFIMAVNRRAPDGWTIGRYHVERDAHRHTKRADGYAFEMGLTNGNPAVLRSLALKVRWPEHRNVGEDVEFNTRACKQSRSNATLNWPLLLYRQHLSAGAM